MKHNHEEYHVQHYVDVQAYDHEEHTPNPSNYVQKKPPQQLDHLGDQKEGLQEQTL